MRSQKSATYLAPAIGADVFSFQNNGTLDPVCTVEHVDPSAGSIALKYRESDDGSTWTDIAGTAATVNPSGTRSNQQVVVSTRRFIALFASGNAKFMFTLDQQVDGSPTQLGAV